MRELLSKVEGGCMSVCFYMAVREGSHRFTALGLASGGLEAAGAGILGWGLEDPEEVLKGPDCFPGSLALKMFDRSASALKPGLTYHGICQMIGFSAVLFHNRFHTVVLVLAWSHSISFGKFPHHGALAPSVG